MESQIYALVGFFVEHPQWVGLAMFVVAFGESLVLVSLLFPATALLIAAGALTPSGVLPIASLLTGAVLGAIAGDGPIGSSGATAMRSIRFGRSLATGSII